MSYDLTIWKWNPTKTPDINGVIEAISLDKAHPATMQFDRQEFEDALRNTFNNLDSENSPFIYEFVSFKGWAANWVVISMSFSQVKIALPKLMDICKTLQLALYDFQSDQLIVGKI